MDFAQIVKFYEAEPMGPGRYSPPKVVDTDKRRVWGNPDMDRVSTSYVERHNLSMRTSIRRLTRLTLGFSKKRESLESAVSLYLCHYNFARRHGSLRVTPATEAGVTNRVWTVGELLDAQVSF